MNEKSICRIKNQQGMSAFAILIVLVFVGLSILCVTRMMPAYVDNRHIETALKSIESPSGDMKDLSKQDIRKQLYVFFRMNKINNDLKDSLNIKVESKRIFVTMDYEVRVPILYNVDVVMTFKNHWDSSAPEKCCKPESETKD